MLRKRERKRRIGNTRTIAHLAYEQIVAHQQGFLKRRGWDLIVLEEERIDKVYRYQSEYDRIDPLHEFAESGIL